MVDFESLGLLEVEGEVGSVEVLTLAVLIGVRVLSLGFSEAVGVLVVNQVIVSSDDEEVVHGSLSGITRIHALLITEDVSFSAGMAD